MPLGFLSDLALKTEPDESLRELVEGEEHGRCRKQDGAGLPDMGKRRDTDKADHSARDEIDFWRKTHTQLPKLEKFRRAFVRRAPQSVKLRSSPEHNRPKNYPALAA
ncbi:hypothetical protein MKK84_32640 [Methylobacterium sp. E-065]|nr:hypothetical protein [Methylobacterium sp. E-065]